MRTMSSAGQKSRVRGENELVPAEEKGMALTKEEASAIVQPILAKYEELFGKNNLSELVLLYGVDAVLIHRGHEAAYGRDAIKSALSSFTQSGPIENKVSDVSIECSGADHIIMRAKFCTKMTETGGEIKGRYEQIFRKENGVWQIVFDEYSNE